MAKTVLDTETNIHYSLVFFNMAGICHYILTLSSL